MVTEKLKSIKHWVGASKDWMESFLDEVKHVPNIIVVVVIGSAIRNRWHQRSDFDLLIVYSGSDRPKDDSPIEVDVKSVSLEDLDDRLRKGSEVLIWAMVFGVPVYDPNGIWEDKLLEYKGKMPLPSKDDAEKRAHRSLKVACEMLEAGDDHAASDLVLASLTQFARSELIQAGTFPASRPELPEQLRNISQGSILADLLEQSMYGSRSIQDLCREACLVGQGNVDSQRRSLFKAAQWHADL